MTCSCSICRALVISSMPGDRSAPDSHPAVLQQFLPVIAAFQSWLFSHVFVSPDASTEAYKAEQERLKALILAVLSNERPVVLTHQENAAGGPPGGLVI